MYLLFVDFGSFVLIVSVVLQFETVFSEETYTCASDRFLQCTRTANSVCVGLIGSSHLLVVILRLCFRRVERAEIITRHTKRLKLKALLQLNDQHDVLLELFSVSVSVKSSLKGHFTLKSSP